MDDTSPGSPSDDKGLCSSPQINLVNAGNAQVGVHDEEKVDWECIEWTLPAAKNRRNTCGRMLGRDIERISQCTQRHVAVARRQPQHPVQRKSAPPFGHPGGVNSKSLRSQSVRGSREATDMCNENACVQRHTPLNMDVQTKPSPTSADFLDVDEPLPPRHLVWLHVYDLGPVTGRLNEFVLRGANLGAFHCGIEVLENEWSFQGFHDAWDDPTLTGIVRNEPRQHPMYIYRESVNMGYSPLDEAEIDNIIDIMMDSWPANMYHLVTRNCVTFAEELAAELRLPEPFPEWVRGAADAGKSPALFAIADMGWSVFKWWSSRQAQETADTASSDDEKQKALRTPAERSVGVRSAPCLM